MDNQFSFFGKAQPEAKFLGDAAANPESLGNTPMLKALIAASQSAIDPEGRRARIGQELELSYQEAMPDLMGPETAEEALQRFAPSLSAQGTVGRLMEDLSGSIEDGSLRIERGGFGGGSPDGPGRE